MEIAILMPLSSPWSRQVAQRLCELGHSVHVVDFLNARKFGSYLYAHDAFQVRSIGSLYDMVTHVHFLGSRFQAGIRYFTCAKQLQRMCRKCRIDVALSLYGGGWATLAYLSGVRPYCVYVVGSDVLRAGTFSRWISGRTLGSSQAVFANGSYLAEKTLAMAPRAGVIPLVIGVDTARFTPRPVAAGPVNVICTRGFMPIYNNEFLIEGLAAVPDGAADLHVTFSSTGHLLPEVQALADRTLRPAVRERVEFLGGVTEDQLLSKLQESHVYVSLSRSDGTSISLLEALACGVFPVLSDIPQNREWIDPALDNGILVPLGDRKALAAALVRAAADPALRARAAEINRRLVLERGDSRKNMAVLAGKLEEIARAGGQSW